MLNKVDPAALLLAVLAVAASVTLGDGPWQPASSVVATVVFLIVAMFTWPTKDMRGDQTRRAGVAQAAAYGFLLFIIAAWPIQAIRASGDQALPATCSLWASDDSCYAAEAPTFGYWVQWGTFGGMIFGFAAFLVLAVVFVVQVGPRSTEKKVGDSPESAIRVTIEALDVTHHVQWSEPPRGWLRRLLRK